MVHILEEKFAIFPEFKINIVFKNLQNSLTNLYKFIVKNEIHLINLFHYKHYHNTLLILRNIAF